MKAIVLSAGQGRRLLPLTARIPKCLLPVDGETSVLRRQLELLSGAGLTRVLVVTGFGARRVEESLREAPTPGLSVETLFNPFYATSDNLATCWLARHAMREDFLLLNGDTLFEPAALERLLAAPPAPITVTIDRKPAYDEDDMKVSLDQRGRLLAIGKSLPAEAVGAESIGMLLFREAGAKLFVEGLERALHEPGALRRWYLSVVNDLAQDHAIETCSIQGLWWQEIDAAADLERARAAAARTCGPFGSP